MNMTPQQIDASRLVLKLFRSTGKRIRWLGTLEELTTREIHCSLGSRRPLVAYAVNLTDYEYMTIVQQNHRTFRWPSLFTCSYVSPKTGKVWYLELKRCWLSVGSDFVIESQGERVAYIDGQLIGFGLNAYVHIYEESLAEDRKFMDLLTLFASSIGFQKAIRRNIKRRLKNLRQKKTSHLIEDEEMWLLKNPRRRAS